MAFIGKWGGFYKETGEVKDGKPLYAKSFSTQLPNATTVAIPHELGNIDLEAGVSVIDAIGKQAGLVAPTFYPDITITVDDTNINVTTTSDLTAVTYDFVLRFQFTEA